MPWALLTVFAGSTSSFVAASSVAGVGVGREYLLGGVCGSVCCVLVMQWYCLWAVRVLTCIVGVAVCVRMVSVPVVVVSCCAKYGLYVMSEVTGSTYAPASCANVCPNNSL